MAREDLVARHVKPRNRSTARARCAYTNASRYRKADSPPAQTPSTTPKQMPHPSAASWPKSTPPLARCAHQANRRVIACVVDGTRPSTSTPAKAAQDASANANEAFAAEEDRMLRRNPLGITRFLDPFGALRATQWPTARARPKIRETICEKSQHESEQHRPAEHRQEHERKPNRVVSERRGAVTVAVIPCGATRHRSENQSGHHKRHDQEEQHAGNDSGTQAAANNDPKLFLNFAHNSDSSNASPNERYTIMRMAANDTNVPINRFATPTMMKPTNGMMLNASSTTPAIPPSRFIAAKSRPAKIVFFPNTPRGSGCASPRAA